MQNSSCGILKARIILFSPDEPAHFYFLSCLPSVIQKCGVSTERHSYPEVISNFFFAPNNCSIRLHSHSLLPMSYPSILFLTRATCFSFSLCFSLGSNFHQVTL